MNVKKFLIILLLALLAFASALAGFAVGIIHSRPFVEGEHGNALAEVVEGETVNFLIVGKDHVGANTDMIMVASLDQKNNKLTMLSIPRDTRVNYHGNRKINSVYGYAGYKGLKKEEALISVVSQVSRLPIHYYAIINLRAFREIVDELGGVEFNVERDYHYDDPFQDLHIHINKGNQVLDGKKAEGLIRFRADYVEGDIKRVGVQQEFLMALIAQKMQMKYISKVPDIYENVKDDVISNMKVSDVLDFAKSAVSVQSETHLLPGSFSTTSSDWIQNEEETDTLIRDAFGYR